MWDRIQLYSSEGINLGDQPLAEWLLPRLFPRASIGLRPDPAWNLLLSGSILGFRNRIHENARHLPWLVLGAGHQYDRPDVPQGSVFFCVRGPDTAALLRDRFVVPMGYADPGIAVPRYLPRGAAAPTRPHAVVHKYDHPFPCAGPDEFTASVEGVGGFEAWVRNLWRYERVTADSLHAAIIADAYGIPWRPLRWEFKWQDHFAALGVNEGDRKEFRLSDRGRLARQQELFDRARLALVDFVGP